LLSSPATCAPAAEPPALVLGYGGLGEPAIKRGVALFALAISDG
jgi:hypothetical protein